MLNTKTGERQALDRSALLRRGLGYSWAIVGPRLPYLVALLRRRISFGLIFGWILTFFFSRIRSKKRKRPELKDRVTTQALSSRQGSAKVVNPRKKLTLWSMALEVLVAVGLNLLRSNVKSWSSEIRPAKAVPVEKTISKATTESDSIVKKELHKKAR